MRCLICVVLLAALLVPAIGAAPQQQPAPMGPGWAFPVRDPNPPPAAEEPGPLKVQGSTKTYTRAQIDDTFNPPDWFPDEHAPLPQVVAHGSGKEVRACGSCHLISGMGHPESAIVAGFTVTYFLQQMADFKSGDRINGVMTGIAKAISEDDDRQAAEYFANLKPFPYIKVVEATTVPKSFVDRGGMRLPLPGGQTEPLGNRIIVLPENAERIMLRDPHGSVTTAYVPVGSIAKGKELVTTGSSGKTFACNICHGPTLEGLGDVPRIAGSQPIYVFRQLYSFQHGTRTGSSAALMKGPVMNLSDDDMVAISAYLGSLAP
jgi:cytochrome c553